MLKALKRWWNYIAAKLGMTLEETADPKVQLEQAITEAREQHRRLTDQAAQVIANQRQLEQRLDRAIEDYEKATASARQAIELADEASRSGDRERANGFTAAAEAFAARIIGLERQIEELKKQVLEATQAAATARQAVAVNATALQHQLEERERLLSKLDQAKMQEQMNAAMAQLTSTAGDDVPTLDEVRSKIDRRLAAAQATTELTGASVDIRMIEVENAQQQLEAQARLREMRTEMGISAPPQLGSGPELSVAAEAAAAEIESEPTSG